ncbi:MAG: hypothetical protein NT047_05800 [Deltaproteobacteria bacterium]|jgi:hypothetical protein|nr:hypothetical protein [Deltaproteobacteria bacterium]
MEIITSTQLAIPLFHVILLLILSTIALLIGSLRLALFINYCFTLYWGYVANLDLFTTAEISKMNIYAFLYFGSGIVIILLAVIGLFMHRE